jgi:predicted RNA-binding Zn-ribbon protein involved in translation (DUF1610 family)
LQKEKVYEITFRYSTIGEEKIEKCGRKREHENNDKFLCPKCVYEKK